MFSFLSRRKPARRPSALPRLEALEDRWTPSVSSSALGDPPELASIQFSPIDYSAGEGAGNATLTVTRSDSFIGTVSVRVRSIGGTATPGVDYMAIDQVLTFTAGQSSKSVPVTILNDALFEGNETVTLELSPATPSTAPFSIDEPLATLTIVDDDPQPQPPGVIQFASATLTVPENGGSATVTLTRTGGSGGAVSVRVRSIGGSAAAGSDYATVDQFVTFAGGQTSASLTVSILNDALFEGDETIILRVSDPTGGATIGIPDTITVTVTSDDPQPPAGSIQFGTPTVTASENGGPVSITLTRTNGNFGAVSVRVRSNAGSALAGSDYVAVDQVVSFADGQSSTSFSVTLVNDTAFEGTESFTLTLSEPTGGASIGGPSTLTVTVNDDDPAPSAGVIGFGPNPFTVAENAGSFTFTLNRTGGSFGAVSVRVRSSDGIAIAGSDYVAVDQIVHFAAGQTSATFTITLLDHAVFEGRLTETVTLTLSEPTGGATLGSDSRGTLNIVENDPEPAGVIQLISPQFASLEPLSPTITLTRMDGSAGAVSVRVRSTGGTATPGSDYMAVDQVVTFADGQTSASFVLPLINDVAVEGDETIVLTLSEPTGGAILGQQSSATLSIVNDDLPPLSGDVSNRVEVTRGPIQRLRPGRFRQQLTLTNLGDRVIQGPLSLELSKLPGARWKVVKNPSAVPGPDNLLDPGESVSLVLVFRARKARQILYSTRVLANPEVIST